MCKDTVQHEITASPVVLVDIAINSQKEVQKEMKRLGHEYRL